MRTLGVDAELTGRDVTLYLPGPRTSVPCFEAPAGGEVVVGGRKLIGSAMRAHAGAILQHGAILLDWDGRLQAGSMGLADDTSLRPHITTLRDELDRDVERTVLEDSLVDSFSAELEIRFDPAKPNETELGREQKLLTSFTIGG
jgi:lipoate-protein ligase A